MSRKQLKNSVPLADASAGLRASLRPPELRNRRRLLLEALDHEDDPEAHLQLAFLDYMTHDFDGARVHGETAYRDFRRRGSRRRAAVAAAAVGRIHFEGYNNLPAARGWFARGRTMLADEGDCVERGWVELGLVGCSVPDVSVLAVKAAAAVELARRFDDIDLECKALADQGLAVVLISHNLHDVFEVATRITVLRLGRDVGVYEREKTTQQEVVQAITAGIPTKVAGIPQTAPELAS